MENGRRRDESQQRRRPAAVVPPQRGGDLLGRHRLSAAIGRLDKEIESLQSELEELDTLEPSSAACKHTRGPEGAAWDRWFQRIRSSRRHKWWAQKPTSFS